MKYITLFRHGKAVEQSPDIVDFERPLQPRGVEDVKLMCQKLSENSIIPEIIIHSTAMRTTQTAQIIQSCFGKHIPLLPEAWIYDDYTSSEFLAFIYSVPDEILSLFFVGHNPNISDVAARLCVLFHASLPTSGNVTLAFDVDSWAKIQPGRAKIIAFYYPKLYR